MNKELEALELFMNTFHGIVTPSHVAMDNAYNTIRTALAVPTAEEICEALRDFLKHKISYEKGNFYLHHHNSIMGWEKEQIVMTTKHHTGKDKYNFRRHLSLEIIEMIIKFFKAQKESE